uniref:Uncharacterized protein n=1 Tax=Anguilla anguilla TaxID=7936 RepID=A0A0E9RH55_ANGAN
MHDPAFQVASRDFSPTILPQSITQTGCQSTISQSLSLV